VFESRSWQGVLDTTLCNKVCQWLTTGRWISLGTPVSSTNRTDRNDITEILLEVALNTITLTKQIMVSHEDHQFLYIFMANRYQICKKCQLVVLKVKIFNQHILPTHNYKQSSILVWMFTHNYKQSSILVWMFTHNYKQSSILVWMFTHNYKQSSILVWMLTYNYKQSSILVWMLTYNYKQSSILVCMFMLSFILS
jgi:hypothetical protein